MSIESEQKNTTEETAFSKHLFSVFSNLREKESFQAITKLRYWQSLLATVGISQTGAFELDIGSVYSLEEGAWFSKYLLLPNTVKLAALPSFLGIIASTNPRLSQRELGYEAFLRAEKQDNRAFFVNVLESPDETAKLYAKFYQGDADVNRYKQYALSVTDRLIKKLKLPIEFKQTTRDVYMGMKPYTPKQQRRTDEDQKDRVPSSNELMRSGSGFMLNAEICAFQPSPENLLTLGKLKEEVDSVQYRSVVMRSMEWTISSTQVGSRKLALAVNLLWIMVKKFAEIHWYADAPEDDESKMGTKRQKVGDEGFGCAIQYPWCVPKEALEDVLRALERATRDRIIDLEVKTDLGNSQRVMLSAIFGIIRAAVAGEWSLHFENKKKTSQHTKQIWGRLAACVAAMRIMDATIAFGLRTELSENYAVIRGNKPFVLMPFPWCQIKVQSTNIDILLSALGGLGDYLEPSHLLRCALGFSQHRGEIDEILHVHHTLQSARLTDDEIKTVRLAASSVLPASRSSGGSILAGQPTNWPAYSNLGKQGDLRLLGLPEAVRPKNEANWGVTIQLPEYGPVSDDLKAALGKKSVPGQLVYEGFLPSSYLDASPPGYHVKITKVPTKRYSIKELQVVDNAAAYLSALSSGLGVKGRLIAARSDAKSGELESVAEEPLSVDEPAAPASEDTFDM